MRLNRDFWIATAVLGFLAGVSNCSLLAGESFIFYMLNLAVLLWFWESRRSLTDAGKKMVFLTVLAAAIVLGMGRFALDLLGEGVPADLSGRWEGIVRVISLPEKKGQLQEMVVEVISGEGREAGQKLLVSLVVQEQISYGEKLLIAGRWTDLQKISDNRKLVLFRRHLKGFLQQTVIVKKLQKGAYDLPGIIYRIRGVLLSSVRQTSSEPVSSLINGVLIGERGDLPQEVSANFQITGLTHVLAISGFNITLIISMVIICLQRYSRKLRFVITVLLVTFFVILTGAGASVIRAGVMGLLLLFVKTMGRRVDLMKIILLSAFFIVVVDPRLLNFDLSFQLSLLATLSLIWFAGRLDFLAGSGWQSILWEGLVTTLAAQVITLPLIFFSFGRISLISPLANLLVGPLIPYLMLSGAIQLLTGLFSVPLALVFTGISTVLVNLMLGIVKILAAVPLAQVEFGQGQIWLACLYYLAVFMVFRKRKSVQG